MDRLTELRGIIIRAKQAYYYTQQPIMEDPAYDALEAEVAEISPLGDQDPVLIMVGCPVPNDNILNKAEHRTHMGSQDKVNSIDEFRKWYAEKAKGGRVHVSWKGDGGSVAAYYEDGFLVQGISRGDGIVGEDISANVVGFKGLPAYIEDDEHGVFVGSIRFEAILTKADWRITGGKNPRNQGNGVLGRKDGQQSGFITAFAFDVENGIEFATETEKSQFLESVGVTVMPWQTFDNADDVVAHYEQIMVMRGGADNVGSLDFWIDGIVIKIDDLAVQAELGLAPSGKYHKGQVAWKPENQLAKTVLRSMEITGGHTGMLIPNARFDPVELGGTTNSNASLANWEEIKRLGVAIGDTIHITRTNDIVPKVIGVVSRPATRQEMPEPTSCPFCNGDVGRNQTTKGPGAITMCLNPGCPAKHDGKLKSWFKKTKILGVGDAVREALHDQLNIHTPADIYKLGAEIPVEQLREILISGESRFGHNADYLVDEINKKRNLPIHIFLGSLGIDGLGRREVEIACQKAPAELSTLDCWRHVETLRDVNLAAKINAPNKAERWAVGIAEMSDIIDGLLANGVTCQSFVPTAPSAEPTGTKVCITGILPSGKKKADYKDALAAAGFVLVKDVKKDISFLVVADPSIESNKSKKAVGYNDKGANIQIVDESRLVEMVGSQFFKEREL
jgi:DNA ligase (NAD+)